MNEFLVNATYFGVLLTLSTYGIGMMLKKKFKFGLLNPLLVSIVLSIAILKLCRIEYADYTQSTKYISYLLTPATVCLAVPLYEQFELLKKNYIAIIIGIGSGVLMSLFSVWMLARLFRLDYANYVTFLPKSITTAIGMVVSYELGGYAALTVVVIVLTGILGNMIAESVCRIFKIEEPIAKGIAIGTASHAIGTTKAMEIGAVEGAMSSLSIVVAGILTVIGVNLFTGLPLS